MSSASPPNYLWQAIWIFLCSTLHAGSHWTASTPFAPYHRTKPRATLTFVTSLCLCVLFFPDHKDHVFVGSLWCQHFGWKWQLRIPPLWLCLWSCLAQWAAECGVNTVRVRRIVHNGIIPVRRETSVIYLKVCGYCWKSFLCFWPLRLFLRDQL